MNKSELMALAEEYGVELPRSMKKARMLEIVEDLLREDLEILKSVEEPESKEEIPMSVRIQRIKEQNS